ncbi:MAG: hypothetical protein KDC90_15280 [Ignavibacteriae bacterium]|nr:hypothetical protein [Ignavibacteriota bacterium]
MYEDEICPDSHRLLDDIMMGSERYIRDLSEKELREIYDLIIEHTTDKLSNVFEYYDELYDDYEDYSDRKREILDYLLIGFKRNKKTRKLYKMLCKKQRGEEYEIED